jgi:hypothetical protein
VKIRTGFVSNSSSSSFVIAYNNGVPLLDTVLSTLNGAHDTKFIDEKIEELKYEIKSDNESQYFVQQIKDELRKLSTARKQFDNVVCITWERGDHTVPDLLRALHRTNNIQIVTEDGV